MKKGNLGFSFYSLTVLIINCHLALASEITCLTERYLNSLGSISKNQILENRNDLIYLHKPTGKKIVYNFEKSIQRAKTEENFQFHRNFFEEKRPLQVKDKVPVITYEDIEMHNIYGYNNPNPLEKVLCDTTKIRGILEDNEQLSADSDTAQ